MRPKVVFFDYGGTLAYMDPAPEAVWLRLLEELGFRPHPEAFQSAFQEAKEIVGRLNLYEYHRRMREYWRHFDGIVFEKLGIADPNGTLAAAIDSGFERRDWYHLYRDVPETLETLRAKRYRLGIISNNVDELLNRLRQFELMHYFDTVTYSQEARADKPDPAIFELALERVGCGPEEAVHVGDSYEADILGARRAGVTPVLVDRDQRFGEADCLRINDLREVMQVVEP